jgi:(1->4)-alpha-D-glucan 1-alpha-D-glucosylmutase
VSFDRGGAITLATRLPATLAASGGWRGTYVSLPGTRVDALTGESFSGALDVGDVLSRYPVALLLPE